MADNILFKREVKSFSKRQRRLTPRQEAALAHCWEKYGVQLNKKPIDLDALFGRSAERVLEIGFGNGESLWQMAKANPQQDYLAIEVHTPGIANLLISMLGNDVHNIRIIEHDAVQVLTEYIANETFMRTQIFFPDPWPKKRHHKRRLIQSDFVQLLKEKLKVGGVIHCATDWGNYAEHMMTILTQIQGLKNMAGDHQYANNTMLNLRPNTKFEQRGIRLGHDVWDLAFQKIA